jgi:soluble lytic murein transglycosylase-like protein
MKTLIIPIVIGACSISFLFYDASFTEARMDKLERSLEQVQNVMEVHDYRQLAVEKIGRIIKRFNSDIEDAVVSDLANEIFKMSVKYPNLDVDLICATITHESARTWEPSVVSHAGAMGLMQIMPSTGKWLAKYEGIEWNSAEDVLFDPILNIRLGTRYLSALIETYDLEGGLAAYNGGGKRVRMWLANNKADGILWKETRDYIPFVLGLYREFKEFPM